MSQREAEIDEFMAGMPVAFRQRWCFPPGSAHGCSCVGCADVAGYAEDFMSYEEWQAWMARHPDGGPPWQIDGVDPRTLPRSEHLRKWRERSHRAAQAAQEKKP